VTDRRATEPSATGVAEAGDASTPVVVSLLAREDLTEVLAIEKAQFDDPWSLRTLREELEDRSRRYTKATVDRELVGYLGLMVLDQEAHVNTIATTPGGEGRGVATALLLEGIRAVVRAGVRDLTLEVASRNLRARRLYERFGFAPVGVRRGYYQRSDDDAVVMWVRDADTPSFTERLAAIELAEHGGR
jgi:ribosomal-protein-alanine N-acetyltransferase